MSKPYPKEFRDDVVRVARKAETSMNQVAKDFGIAESTLSDWLKKADLEDGITLPTASDSELKKANKRIRLLEQENEILRRAAIYLGQANLPKG